MPEVWGFGDENVARRAAKFFEAPRDVATNRAPPRRRQGSLASTELYIYTLTEDMGTITTETRPAAHADLKELDNADSDDGVTLIDTIGLASWQTTGGKGICARLGSKYYVVVPECEPEDTGTGG